jgi:hypothetical protein
MNLDKDSLIIGLFNEKILRSYDPENVDEYEMFEFYLNKDNDIICNSIDKIYSNIIESIYFGNAMVINHKIKNIKLIRKNKTWSKLKYVITGGYYENTFVKFNINIIDRSFELINGITISWDKTYILIDNKLKSFTDLYLIEYKLSIPNRINNAITDTHIDNEIQSVYIIEQIVNTFGSTSMCIKCADGVVNFPAYLKCYLGVPNPIYVESIFMFSHNNSHKKISADKLKILIQILISFALPKSDMCKSIVNNHISDSNEFLYIADYFNIPILVQMFQRIIEVVNINEDDFRI